MGGACSLVVRGRCAEEEGKKETGRGGEGGAGGRRQTAVTGSSPQLNSGGGLLASNQDAACVRRTGCVSTICHKIGSVQFHQPNTCEGNSQGVVAGAKYTTDRGKRGPCLLPITDDGDFCPTCLEGYNEDNPKILTKCNHHYHLSCILEWKERSDNCPICDKTMDFEEF